MIDQEIFEKKKQELLDKLMSAPETTFSAAEDPEQAIALDKEIFEIVLDLFAIQRGLDPNNKDVRKKLTPYGRAQMATFDPNDPAVTYSAKIMRLLANDQTGAASSYADALGQHKKKEFSDAQTQRASGLRPTPYGKFLEELLLADPAINEEQVLRRIDNQRLIYPIYDLSEEWIWVYTSEEEPAKEFPKTKRYKVSALGSNLSQARRNLRKSNKDS
jgi:hypothetical protein